MRYIPIVVLAFVLGGCTTLQGFHEKAANYACEHKEELIASALAVQDYAAIDAITNYCSTRGL